jgi:hypothetical protein
MLNRTGSGGEFARKKELPNDNNLTEVELKDEP